MLAVHAARGRRGALTEYHELEGRLGGYRQALESPEDEAQCIAGQRALFTRTAWLVIDCAWAWSNNETMRYDVKN